ncbi:MFS general substrate transporter [Epithele typhae]|uniref:MFS general substrate transporter n=1 Tax=Epithele typhae TaxID=378194 RepID=UPI002008AC59|nr:MFS general substrate transporter [Epithele typhae]KAH9926300.1 MFS general substrate transporter [Epithele typhae]
MEASYDETTPLLVPEAQHGDAAPQQEQHVKKTPLPKLQVSALVLAHMGEPMTAYCIFPFVNQLVSELDITGGDEKKVGYYVGMIESIFFVTQALFVFHWGRVSDHVGRKPVLMIGLFGLVIAMLSFGLSKTFLGIVVSRSICGLLNGNAGVIKSMMGEITDSTNMAQGFAFIPVAWSMGSTIAPWIGGQLSKPHERWPTLFSHPFWSYYPYFLPCALSAAYCAFACAYVSVALKETVKRRSRSSSSPETASSDADEPPPLREALTRPVVLSIAVYASLGAIDIAFMALFPLFCATPIALGGLGLGPPQIGAFLGALGVCDGLFQGLVFSRAVDRLGVRGVLALSLCMFVPMYALFPVASAVARAYGVGPGVWAIMFAQLALTCVMDMSYGAVFMVIRSAVPNNRALGTVNGVAQFVAAVMRAIAPVATTSLFAASLEYNLLGGYFVYVVCVTASVGVALTPRLLRASGMWFTQ